MKGGRSEMESTGPVEEFVKFFSSPHPDGKGLILASDNPFFGVNRQHFGKKRLPNYGNRPFQPRICGLILSACPEMTLFSNDTGPFPGYEVLGDDLQGGMKETLWQRFRLSPDQRCSAGGMTGAALRGIVIRKKCEKGICYE